MLREAVAARRETGRSVSVRVTWERGDARRYVAEAIADGIDCVIAAGGDGTVGETAGALAEFARDGHRLPALAAVPMGTANDFGRAAGLPESIDEALELAAHGRPQRVDILRVSAGPHSRWCFNLASGGFGTEATVEAHDLLKKVLGGFSYVVKGIARLHAIESTPIELRGPGFRWHGPMIVLGVGNARLAGGGQLLCPDALIDDGLLDVTVVPELEEGVVMTMVNVVVDGKRATLERVAARARLPWVEIRAAEPLRLNLDGEPMAARRLRIDCVPGALSMYLPRDCPLVRRTRAIVSPQPNRTADAEPL